MAVAKSTRRKRGKDGPNPSVVFQDRIEAERRRLQKASALLITLVYSSSQGLDSEQAGDVAGVAALHRKPPSRDATRSLIHSRRRCKEGPPALQSFLSGCVLEVLFRRSSEGD